MKTSPRILLWSMFVSAWTIPHAQAADAAFSPDGKTVYFLDAPQEKPGALEALQVDSGTLREITIPNVEKDGEIEAISPLSKDALLVVTKTHAWHWNDKANEAKIIETAPEGASFLDAAADSQGRQIVLTTYRETPDADHRTFELYLKRTESEKAVDVFVRRVEALKTPVYLPDGTLLFGSDGDLWHGQVEWDKDAEPGHPRGILSGYRFAPLATRETSEGTPSQIGVQRIAASRGHLYVEVSRMGGSGWGDLVRLELPPAKEKGELNLLEQLPERLSLYSRVLKSVLVLEPDQGSQSFLCASPNGETIHYTGPRSESGDRVHYLIGKDGKKVPVKTRKGKA